MTDCEKIVSQSLPRWTHRAEAAKEEETTLVEAMLKAVVKKIILELTEDFLDYQL